MTTENVVELSSASQAAEIRTGFQKREGTTDRRSDYINLTIAHLSVQLATAASITNFELSSGDKKHGNFHDIVLDVTETTRKKYSMQFRYSQKSVGVGVESFTGNGKLGVRKIFENFKKAENVLDDFDLVLFTNMKMEPPERDCYDFRPVEEKEKLLEKKKPVMQEEERSEISFKLKLVKVDFETELLVKLGMNNSVYKFEICSGGIGELTVNGRKVVDEYREFFAKFFLYTDQKLVEEMETVVHDDLFRVFKCKNTLVARVYKDFVTRWSKRDDSKPRLNRAIVRVKLAESLLVPHVVVDSQTGEVAKFRLIRDAILKSDITLVDPAVGLQVAKIIAEAVISHDWGENDQNVKKEFHATGKKYEVFNKNYNPLDFGHRSRLLWHMNLVPLVVQLDQNSAEHVLAAVKLCDCKGGRRKFVLVGNQIERKFLEDCAIFQNLRDLALIDPEIYRVILETCRISLQGRTPIPVKRLVQDNDEMATAVTTKEIIEMVDGTEIVQAGEDKETVIDYYMDRSLRKVVVGEGFVVNVDAANIAVVSCKGMLSKLRRRVNNNKVLIDVSEYLAPEEAEDETPLGAKLRQTLISYSKFVVTAAGEISTEEFEEICKVDPRKTYHHLKVVEDSLVEVSFEWVTSNGSLEALGKYQVGPSPMLESRIFDSSGSKVKVICADPGMGKSVMVNYLKNNYPAPVWVAKFAPNQHFKFFETSRNPSEVLDYIFNSASYDYKTFDLNVREALRKRKRVAVLWDGLDEMPQICVEFALEAIEGLRALGLVQFVAARRHLERVLQEKFQTFSLAIEPFDRDQQRSFIRKRLAGLAPEAVEEITEKVVDNVNVIPEGFLGIPLQIFFLTELFLRNPQKYGALLDNSLPITETYHYFVEEKFNFLHEKANCALNNHLVRSLLEDNKNYLLPIYEIAGLSAALDPEDFESLQLDCSCLEEIAVEGDGFGVVVKVTNKVPVFAHNSYGEYFSAVWLERNFASVADLSFLFKIPYRNVQFMFDMIMAQDCPGHLAVLYRNFDYLRENSMTIFRKDKGGRTPLHLAASWGTKYPRIETANFGGHYTVDYNRANNAEDENEDFAKVLVYLTDRLDFRETDRIFGWDCVEYADRALCLLPLEAFLRLQPDNFRQVVDLEAGTRGKLRNYGDRCSIVYYSALQNYRSLWGFVEKIPDFQDENGNNMIHETAKSDRRDCLEKVLRTTDVDINCLNSEGSNALHYAAAAGHLEVVEFLVQNGINVNKASNAGLTPLHLAVVQQRVEVVKYLLNNTDARLDGFQGCHLVRLAGYSGDLEMVKLLVPNFVDVNASSDDNNTILHDAANGGHLELAEFLVASGANVNATNDQGYNALFLASNAGHLELTELLLDNHGNIEQHADNGMTPLQTAAFKGHYEIVKLLIARGANPSATSTVGFTPLHLAAYKGFSNIVQFLLNHIDINATTLEGETPLFLAAIGGNPEVVKLLISKNCDISTRRAGGLSPLQGASFYGYPEVVKVLIASGCDINETTDDKMNALHLAAVEGHLEVIKILVNAGIKIGEVTEKGSNALHFAVEGGHLEIVRVLVDNGIDVNAKKKDGSNLLHFAAARGDFEVAEFLVDNGIEVDATNGEGDNALQISAENGHLEVVRLLIRKGVALTSTRYGSNLLHLAAAKGRLEVVKFLLEENFDVNSRAMHGQNSLYLAAENGHLDVVKFLVSKEIVVEATREDKYNALHAAAIDGHCEVVEFLVDYIDVNALTQDNETALHIASEHGHLNVVHTLIQEGIDVNIFDKYAKFNALHFAVSREHPEIVECLLGSDIDKNVIDSEGNTYLHLAVRCDNLAIPQLLIDYGININAANHDGNTALLLAILRERWQLAQLLIDNGIYLNASNNESFNALHLAAKVKNTKIVKIIEALVEGGIWVNATTSRKQNALHLALVPPITLAVVNCLLDSGIDVNAVDDCGLNALFLTLIAEHLELFATLIAGYGANFNAIYPGGNTLLHYAAIARQNEFFEILLQLKCDVNVINDDGNSPLHQAVRYSKIAMVKALVNEGARVDCVNKNEETPYSMALTLELPEIAKVLREKII